MSQSAPKVFISYSPRDAQAVAARLHASLNRRYEVWQDIHDIRRGGNWDEEIETGLRNSNVMVFLLTPQSVREKGSRGNKDNTDSVCRDELSFARDHGIPVVPVRVLPCDTPLLIHRLQQVDFQRWQESHASYDAGFQLICETVDAVLRGEKRERAWGRLLAAWDFEPFLREKLHDFTGREWLFAEIEEWLQKDAEKALIITGDPGVGKSAVVAALVHKNPDGQVLAYHCCRADTKATTDPAVFVRSVVAMLVARLDGYEAMLEEPNISRVLDKADEDPASAFEAAILGPLGKLPPPQTGTRYLLIDALDEALTRERRPTIVEVLSTRLNRLPLWLRIVATTRMDAEVLARLKDLEARELKTQDPRNLDDVRRFVVSAINGPKLRPQVEASGRLPTEIAESFLKSSGGNFLIVCTTLDAVRRGQLTLRQAETLPLQLDVRYRTFFDRLFAEAGVDFKPTRELLEIMLAAHEPLNSNELAAATGLDEDYDLGPLLDRLAAFLPVRDRCHAVFHKSLADWLTGKYADSGQWKAGPYHVKAEKGQQRLANWCWIQYELGPDKASLYCLRHLPAHLAETSRNDRLRRLLLDFNWLQSKLSATDVGALIADYDHLPGDEEVGLVQGAIRLSAHAVAPDKNQLAGQLVGRLSGETTAGVTRLVLGARSWRRGFWLRPMSASLHQPLGPLVRTLAGHNSPVLSVTFTPDERHVVSGHIDGRIVVWDILTGTIVRTLIGHKERVFSVAVTPDGLRIVSLAYDDSLMVWNFEDGRKLRSMIPRHFQGLKTPIACLALTPDGEKAISSYSNNIIQVWDLETGRELQTIQGHACAVHSVVVSRDGQWIVAGSGNWREPGEVNIWDLQSGHEVLRLPGPFESVSAVAITPDSSRVISASGMDDCKLTAWDLKAKRVLFTLKGHSSIVSCLSITSDGRWLVSASWDNTLKLWDLDRGVEVLTLQGHSKCVHSVAVMPSDNVAISASDDATVKLWNLQERRQPDKWVWHTKEVTSVAITPDCHRAVSSSRDGTIKVWDMTRGLEIRILNARTNWVKSLALTAHGNQAICADSKTLILWDLHSGEQLQVMEGHNDLVEVVRLFADGRRAASACRDNTLRVWDLQRGRMIRELSQHFGPLNDVAVTPDGRRIVAIYFRELTVWDAESGRKLHTMEGHTDSITSAVLTADGGRAVSTSRDGTIIIWNLETGKANRVLHGHTGWVTSAVLTPDDRGVVSAADDGVLTLCDIYGRKLQTLVWHTRVIASMVISQDGRHLVSSSYDRTIKVWDLASAVLLATLELEGTAVCCSIGGDNRTIVAGEDSGRVHVLRLVLPEDPIDKEETNSRRESKPAKGHTAKRTC